jgi:dihydroxyacid dehydratase/phosphogluconate dehydratase
MIQLDRMQKKLRPEQLRSYRWFGPADMQGFGHRSRIKQIGYRPEDFMGKPLIAIVNTWSEINPCHYHLREGQRLSSVAFGKPVGSLSRYLRFPLRKRI